MSKILKYMQNMITFKSSFNNKYSSNYTNKIVKERPLLKKLSKISYINLSSIEKPIVKINSVDKLFKYNNNIKMYNTIPIVQDTKAYYNLMRALCRDDIFIII
jgi:hypothetical protein